MLLLDTHAWIWSVENDRRRLGRRSSQLLARADRQQAIRISPVSVFEVAALTAAGRLKLGRPAEAWIREALGQPGVRLAELTTGIALDAGLVPRTMLADPLDRMIVATAQRLDATLLTGDGSILTYAQTAGTIRVHDVGL